MYWPKAYAKTEFSQSAAEVISHLKNINDAL